MKKRLLGVILAIVMCPLTLLIAACGDDGGKTPPPPLGTGASIMTVKYDVENNGYYNLTLEFTLDMTNTIQSVASSERNLEGNYILKKDNYVGLEIVVGMKRLVDRFITMGYLAKGLSVPKKVNKLVLNMYGDDSNELFETIKSDVNEYLVPKQYMINFVEVEKTDSKKINRNYLVDVLCYEFNLNYGDSGLAQKSDDDLILMIKDKRNEVPRFYSKSLEKLFNLEYDMMKVIAEAMELSRLIHVAHPNYDGEAYHIKQDIDSIDWYLDSRNSKQSMLDLESAFKVEFEGYRLGQAQGAISSIKYFMNQNKSGEIPASEFLENFTPDDCHDSYMPYYNSAWVAQSFTNKINTFKNSVASAHNAEYANSLARVKQNQSHLISNQSAYDAAIKSNLTTLVTEFVVRMQNTPENTVWQGLDNLPTT